MFRILATCLLLLSSLVHAGDKVGSYQAALDKMQAQKEESTGASPLTDKDRATMKSFNAYLAKTMPNPGIQVGEKAPNFSLKSAFGKTVSLADELKKGPVILIFYRGSWCPYCNLHLNVLKQAQPKFDKYNAQIIAITPQMPDRSAKQIEKDGYPFEVLSDSDSQVMKDYQLYFELSDELLAVYKKFNLNLEKYNGIGRNVLPVPGGFVIDSDGTVIAMEAQTDYKSRIEPKAILTALAQNKNRL
jgi:peroxiredoxin